MGWKTVGGMCRAPLFVAVFGIFVGFGGEFEHFSIATVVDAFTKGCLSQTFRATAHHGKGSLARCAFLHMFSWSRHRTWMARTAKSPCLQKECPMSCSCSQSPYYLSIGPVELMAKRHAPASSLTPQRCPVYIPYILCL